MEELRIYQYDKVSFEEVGTVPDNQYCFNVTAKEFGVERRRVIIGQVIFGMVGVFPNYSHAQWLFVPMIPMLWSLDFLTIKNIHDFMKTQIDEMEKAKDG